MKKINVNHLYELSGKDNLLIKKACRDAIKSGRYSPDGPIVAGYKNILETLETRR